MKITDIMRPAVTVPETATYFEVLETMIQEKTNAVLAVNENGELVGEVTVLALIQEMLPDYIEDDPVAAHFATDEIFNEDSIRAKDQPIKKFMRKGIKTLNEKSSLTEGAVVAASHGQSRTPIVDENNKPIGVLTRTEIKNIIAQALGIETAFRK